MPFALRLGNVYAIIFINNYVSYIQFIPYMYVYFGILNLVGYRTRVTIHFSVNIAILFLCTAVPILDKNRIQSRKAESLSTSKTFDSVILESDSQFRLCFNGKAYK